MAQVILGLTMRTGMTSCFCMLHTIIEYVLERDIATTKGLLLNELTGTNAAMECHLDVLNVENLCNILRPKLETHHSYIHDPVSVEIQVAVALRMLAGASYLDVADIHGVSDTSVYYILHRFCAAVNGNQLFDFKLGFDNTSYLQHLDNGFEKRSTALGFLKGCIGALDGLVVAIKCPDKRDVPNPSRYYCRKGYYGLNLQAMCDSDLRFTWAEMKWPGSTNDSLALQSSSLMHTILKKKLKSQYFIVADNGYPISDHVLTPFKGRTLTTERDTFNFYLSQKRQTIERAFDVLIGRWGILWKPLRFDFKHAISITKACMRLHNFLIDDNSSHISLMEMCLVPIDDEHGAGGYIENPPLIEDFLNTNNLKHVINKANVKRDKLAHDIYAVGLRRPGSAS
eukprot:g39764.t1